MMNLLFSRTVRCWLPFCSVLALLWCFGLGCAGNKHTDRATVTFVLGEDHYDVNPYYAHALAYYRQNPQACPGQLVTHCRSLREVCDYLEQNVPRGQPWGTINLVAHSTAWTGMDLPVLPGDSSRMTTATLLEAREAGLLAPLPDRVLDGRTEIRLHGCALGLDTVLLRTLSAVLGGADDACPRVVSSRYFNQYEPDSDGTVEQSLAEFWYVNYPTYRRPPAETRAKRLADKHPETDLDWLDALSRRRPRWPGDAYWRPVVVPVQWVVTYPDSASRPGLDSPEAQQKWLESQPELQAEITRLGLDAGEFRWSFRKETMRFEDGAEEPAIIAEGQTTVCCVLRQVPEHTSAENRYVSAQFRQKPAKKLFGHVGSTIVSFSRRVER